MEPYDILVVDSDLVLQYLISKTFEVFITISGRGLLDKEIKVVFFSFFRIRSEFLKEVYTYSSRKRRYETETNVFFCLQLCNNHDLRVSINTTYS